MPHLGKPDLELIEKNQTVKILHSKMILREGKSEQTLKRYLDGIKEITEFLKATNPDEALKILENTTDRTGKLDSFIDYLMSQKRSAIDIKSKWYGVKKWIIYNRLNNIDWEFITRPKAVTQIKDRMPTREELRRILDNRVSLRDKSLYLLMAVGGFRVGTALSLQVKDYEPIEDLGKITVEGGDGRKLAVGKMYFSFITPECRRILESYLKTRGTLKPEDPLFAKESHVDGKGFGYGTNASRQWTILLKRAGLAEKVPNGKSYTIHAHTLRKFFQTTCKLATCRSDFVDFWMGHTATKSDEYLNDSYFRPELQSHIKEYRKAVADLSIFEEGINSEKLSNLEKDLKDKDRQIEEQNKRMENMEKQFQQFVNMIKHGDLHAVPKIDSKVVNQNPE